MTSVYYISISPNAKLGIYSSGIEHNLQLISTKDGKKTDRLVGHQDTPTKVMFTSEDTLISAGDETVINSVSTPNFSSIIANLKNLSISP